MENPLQDRKHRAGEMSSSSGQIFHHFQASHKEIDASAQVVFIGSHAESTDLTVFR